MSEVQALVECPVIVGTAGHVDHGKSALIEALTGKNPDRLEVERRRGMTVELGFGELELPSGKIVGLVDVPGPRALLARPWCRAPRASTWPCWWSLPSRA